MKRTFTGIMARLFPAVLAVLLAGHALADLSIVVDSGDGDGEHHEYLISGPRVRLNQGAEVDLLVLCEAGEFAWLIPEAEMYWQGTPAGLIDEFDDFIKQARGEDDAFSLGALFSEDRGERTPVRVTQSGQEEFFGYPADEYLVEYERDGEWLTHETVWVAPGLLAEIENETGGCFGLVDEALLSLVAVMVGDLILDDDDMGRLWDVMMAPEYRQLTEKGFPVKNHTIGRQFGVTVETTSEVISISSNDLPEEQFGIPDSYTRLSLLELAR